VNTVVWHLQKFFITIHVPAALAPLLAFVVLVGILWALYALVVRVQLVRDILDRKGAAFWLFISPWLFGFLIFTLGPMLFSLYISFTRWNLLTAPSFIGIKNYSDAFSDPLMLQALKVTFYYALLSVPTSVICAFLVATLMNARARGIRLFRTMWYLPSLIVGVPQVVLFLWVFNPSDGIVNGLLAKVGITGPAWFNSQSWAVPTVALMALWTVGGGMIVYLAGMQDIPASLYEAVSLDGGGILRKWWTVTLPQMSPLIFFNFLTGIIGAMQIFTQGFVLSSSGGGPNNSLLFFVFLLYQNAFENFQMGYASAMAWILFFIILAMTIIVFRTSRSFVFYESGPSQNPAKRRKYRAANHAAG